MTKNLQEHLRLSGINPTSDPPVSLPSLIDQKTSLANSCEVNSAATETVGQNMATAKSDFAERFVSGKYVNGDHSAGRAFKHTGEALFAIGELRVRIREQGLDLKSAIDLVVGCTQKITRSSGVVVGLLQQDRVVYPARGGIAATMAGLHFHTTLFQSCLKRGEAVHLPDAQKHPLVGATCGRHGIGSLIIVPIFHNRAVAGGMEVLFKEKRSISAEDLVDLELFAGVISEGLNGAARIVLTQPEQPEYPPEIQAPKNIGPHVEPYCARRQV